MIARGAQPSSAARDVARVLNEARLILSSNGAVKPPTVLRWRKLHQDNYEFMEARALLMLPNCAGQELIRLERDVQRWNVGAGAMLRTFPVPQAFQERLSRP
jgi:hypothetical protein